MREYYVVIAGIEHTVQMTDAEAEQLGVADKVVTRSAEPSRIRARSRVRNKEA